MENSYSKLNVRKLTISAIVIALYVIVMVCTQSIAFGAIQIRFATALYALSYLFPFLVLPLGISNLLSNMLLGGLGFFDIVGGTLVGIITSYLVHLVKKHNLNTYLIIPPIILVPGLVVPIWLSQILQTSYIPLAISLCLGQVIPAFLGRALIELLKNKIGEI